MAEAISQSPSFILSLSYLFVKVSQSGPFIADDDDDDVLPDVFLPRPLYGLFPISLSLFDLSLSPSRMVTSPQPHGGFEFSRL